VSSGEVASFTTASMYGGRPYGGGDHNGGQQARLGDQPGLG